MKITDKIAQADNTLFSIEILPPLKGEHFENIHANIEKLLKFNPAFIDVTYHQQEVEFRELPNGTIEKKAVRKRPGTVGISAAIQYRTNIDVVPHLICGGFSREETENALIDLHFIEIDNILIVRGDPPANQRSFKPEKNGHAYAVDLVKQVNDLNHGIYLDDELQNSSPTDFCIGIAGYPEKHAESPNKESDMDVLKSKVDAGADYIVTQMFFDNEKYFRYVDDVRKAGIELPIIAGLKPLATARQLIMLPQTFHIDIPQELVQKARKFEKKEDIRKLGVEWAIQQSLELKKFGTPCLHYYTMGNATNIAEIAKEVFG
jgi:methylenetetrahydrofolate reductase (NADPH)